MRRLNYLLALTIFSSVGPYCLASIIAPISISEQVKGSGGTSMCLDMFCSQLLFNSFAFDVTNTTPGFFSVSKSGEESLSASSPCCVVNATVTSSSDQTSDVSDNHISVALDASTEVNGLHHFAGSSGTSSSQFLLLFDLTSPATVHLAGTVGDFRVTDSFGATDAHLFLSSPGFEFAREESCPNMGEFCIGATPFDEQFMLDPGVYQLSAFTSANEVAGNEGSGGSAGANLSVNADFSAVVPEPHYMPVLLVALLVVVASTRSGVEG